MEDFRRGQLVNIRVFYNRKYCTSPGRGVENVYFKNITYTGSNAEPSVIEGYDDPRAVRNVIFENLEINGVLIWDQMPKPAWYKTSDMARFFVGEHVNGIEFRKAEPAPFKTRLNADPPWVAIAVRFLFSPAGEFSENSPRICLLSAKARANLNLRLSP